MKFCMIGCGGHASFSHGPSQAWNAKHHPEVELCACCDLSEARAKDYQTRFGFQRYYTDLVAMLDREKPDAATLVVPEHLTCRMVIPILQRGLPLQLEKPPGLTSVELEQLISAANEKDTLHQVAFNRRFMPVLVEARRVLDEHIAPESVLQINYDMARFNRHDADFSTTAIHGLDAILFLARSPYRCAQFTYRQFPELGAGVQSITMVADCVSGTQVRLNCQPISGINAESAILHARGQTLSVVLPMPQGPQFDGTVHYWHNEKLEASYTDAGMNFTAKNGIYGATEDFLISVLAGKSGSHRLQDCRQQVRLMEAIRHREPQVVF